MEPNTQNSPKIELSSIDNGSHGDHWSGLLGYKAMQTEPIQQLVQQFMAYATLQPAIMENEDWRIKEMKLEATFGEQRVMKVRLVEHEKDIISAYPVVETEYVLPFSSKKIVEWSHVDQHEAEIYGSGRNTFAIGFFATDYATNRERYLSEKELNIRLSGIALVMDKGNLTEIGGQPVGPDFAAYMPSKDIQRLPYFDFIGVLEDFDRLDLAGGNHGYLTRIRLINQPENPDFLTITVFVNQENMRFQDLEKGMQVTGMVWLQGEIA